MHLPERRSFLSACAQIGAGSALFPGVLWAKIAGGADITPQTIADAEEIAGVHFDAAQRELMVDALKRQQTQIDALHKVPLDNSVAPAFVFDPLPPGKSPPAPGPRRAPVRSPVKAPARPANLEELAFLPVTQLSELVRTRKVTSTELTKMYLARIAR